MSEVGDFPTTEDPGRSSPMVSVHTYVRDVVYAAQEIRLCQLVILSYRTQRSASFASSGRVQTRGGSVAQSRIMS
jgi:hypothetical protein